MRCTSASIRAPLFAALSVPLALICESKAFSETMSTAIRPGAAFVD